MDKQLLPFLTRRKMKELTMTIGFVGFQQEFASPSWAKGDADTPSDRRISRTFYSNDVIRRE